MERFFRALFAPRIMCSDVSEVRTNLYLSSVDPILNKKTMRSLDIGRVVTLDAMPIEDSYKLPNTEYLFIKIADNPHEDIISRFEECHQFISEGLARQQKVIVHCVAGMSRSATIVISYLMVAEDLPFETAMAVVRKKRTIVCPNDGFQSQLKLFDIMNRKLDPMHNQFRQHLVRHLKWQVCRNRPWFASRPMTSCQMVSKYLETRSSMDRQISANKRFGEYKCKNCRFCLFSQLNVFKNETKDPNDCQLISIEPQEWMSDLIGQHESGTISCPKCHSNLGHFNWSGMDCDCSDHKQLSASMVMIKAKKVDLPFSSMT